MTGVHRTWQLEQWQLSQRQFVMGMSPDSTQGNAIQLSASEQNKCGMYTGHGAIIANGQSRCLPKQSHQ
jgi:hypothetical protein